MLYGKTKRVENVGVRAGASEERRVEVVLVEGWAVALPCGPEGRFIDMMGDARSRSVFACEPTSTAAV